MTSETIPLIFGEVLFDCFEDGSQVLGGAPFNVAWHLQAFGSQPIFVSRVGDDDSGEQIRHAMSEWGMSLAALQTDAKYPTGKVAVTIEQGEPSYEIVEHSAYDYIEPQEFPRNIEPGMIYHGTLALRNADSLKALQNIKRKYPVPIFMDVNLRAPWWDKKQVTTLLQDVTWLKINEHELTELAPEGSNDIERAASLIQRSDLSLVIVTRGSKGALVINKNNESSSVIPEHIADVVDTVGAGDAFASVCIFGLLAGWDDQTILNRAQSFASKMVAQHGATVNNKEFYQPFVQQWCDHLTCEK